MRKFQHPAHESSIHRPIFEHHTTQVHEHSVVIGACPSRARRVPVACPARALSRTANWRVSHKRAAPDRNTCEPLTLHGLEWPKGTVETCASASVHEIGRCKVLCAGTRSNLWIELGSHVRVEHLV